jgi:hypothetical protein
MKEKMTQSECKEEFIKLLNHFMARIDEIDKATPWSVSEPDWWMEMMDYKTKAYDTIIARSKKS